MDVTNCNTDTKKSDRLFALDSLRGIAAFIVVLGHLFLMYPEVDSGEMPLWLRISPLRILINGHASVILFFVLSGYVLSIPFLRGDKQPYFSYLIKRICRIYIPFAFSIILAVILYNYSTPANINLGSDWFHRGWEGNIFTLGNIISHLMMTGVENEMWLNGVMWSLVVELRISIIFPILMYLSRFPRLFVVSAAFIYLLTTSIIVFYGWQMLAADNFAGTFLVTLRFVPFFMVGIFLAKNHEQIQKYVIEWTKLQIAVVVFLALFIFYMPTEIYNIENMSTLSTIITQEELNFLMKFGVDFLLGVASCALIVLARNFGDKSIILNSRPIMWLGKISYSLYLIHLPLVFVIFRLLLGKMPFLWICLIAIITSIIAASIFFIIVEKPAIRVGKYLTRISKRFSNA